MLFIWIYTPARESWQDERRAQFEAYKNKSRPNVDSWNERSEESRDSLCQGVEFQWEELTSGVLRCGENRSLTFFLSAHCGEREQLDLTHMKCTRRDLEFIDWLMVASERDSMDEKISFLITNAPFHSLIRKTNHEILRRSKKRPFPPSFWCPKSIMRWIVFAM